MSKCPLTNCIRMCYVGFFLSVLEYVWELNCIPLNSWICLTAVYWYPTMCIVWGMDVDKGAVPQPCEEPQASWYSVPALGCHESCMPSWLRQHRGMCAIEVHTNAACIVSEAFSGQVGHLCVLYSPSGNSENSHTNSTAFHSQNVHLGKARKERVDCRCGGWKADSACNPSNSCLQHVCWCWPYKTRGTRSQYARQSSCREHHSHCCRTCPPSILRKPVLSQEPAYPPHSAYPTAAWHRVSSSPYIGRVACLFFLGT